MSTITTSGNNNIGWTMTSIEGIGSYNPKAVSYVSEQLKKIVSIEKYVKLKSGDHVVFDKNGMIRRTNDLKQNRQIYLITGKRTVLLEATFTYNHVVVLKEI